MFHFQIVNKSNFGSRSKSFEAMGLKESDPLFQVWVARQMLRYGGGLRGPPRYMAFLGPNKAYLMLKGDSKKTLPVLV